MRQARQSNIGDTQDRATPRRTEPVTFRVSGHLIEELKREAALNQEDLSPFGRDVLSMYIEWGRHATRLNFLPVSKEFLKETFEYLSDEVIDKLASRAGRNTMVDLTLLVEGTLTLEAFLSVFNKWLKACGMTVRFEKVEGYSCVITHTMGRKWSLYLRQLVRAMCKELPTKVQSDFQLRDDTLTFRLSVAHQSG